MGGARLERASIGFYRSLGAVAGGRVDPLPARRRGAARGWLGAADERRRSSLVVAVAENGVIGASGGLPWRIKADLKRFRALTMGKPMIMGRKTFDSIGRVLDGRDNIVVTRQRPAPCRAGVIVAHAACREALALGAERAGVRGVERDLRHRRRRDLRRDDAASPTASMSRMSTRSRMGDVFFPAISPADWAGNFARGAAAQRRRHGDAATTRSTQRRS